MKSSYLFAIFVIVSCLVFKRLTYNRELPSLWKRLYEYTTTMILTQPYVMATQYCSFIVKGYRADIRYWKSNARYVLQAPLSITVMVSGYSYRKWFASLIAICVKEERWHANIPLSTSITYYSDSCIVFLIYWKMRQSLLLCRITI